jgi:hypothetical protein
MVMAPSRMSTARSIESFSITNDGISWDRAKAEAEPDRALPDAYGSPSCRLPRQDNQEIGEVEPSRSS